MSKKRILITAFEPFGGESLNPSQLLLEKLQRESSFLAAADFQLLPVSFAKASAQAIQLLKQREYDLVVHLGQAGGRKHVCMERVALNWIESKRDEDGVRPEGGAISERAPAAYLSELPLNHIRDDLKAQELPIAVSLSAGAFVCNHVYFSSQNYVREMGLRTEVLFVHVPYLPEQAVDKPEGTPSLDFATMYKTVHALIESLKKIPV